MAQARMKPLDNAEQDYVLRQRLSHPLSHRPLLSIRSKLSASRADPTAASSLLAELQSYLLSLTRTHLSSTSTTAGQIEEYEEQYAEIQAEEEASTARIAELKQQLEEVRRRRREKIEYGRVAESVERWFKTGSVDRASGGSVEIEESLSTLVSHLTSSFLYKSDSSEEETSNSSSTVPNHSATLTQLHSKLDEMLNLSRQVREIVGWKSGPSGSGSGSGNTNNRSTDSTQQQLNPNAKPFQPVPVKRPLNTTDLEEGEAAPSPAASHTSGKRQKVVSTANHDEDEDDEEGSIPVATPTAAPVSSNTSRRGGAGAGAPRGRAPRGRARGGKSGWD